MAHHRREGIRPLARVLRRKLRDSFAQIRAADAKSAAQ
jgi:hypothetical protein